MIFFSSCEKHIEDGVKPCPLCGKVDALAVDTENQFNDTLESIKETYKRDTGCISLFCKRCHINLTIFECREYQQSLQDLIKKWNERR